MHKNDIDNCFPNWNSFCHFELFEPNKHVLIRMNSNQSNVCYSYVSYFGKKYRMIAYYESPN